MRRRWSRMRWFISAFSESGEDEGAARLVRRRIRRSRSAFTTSDMVGEGVESREEMRMGEEERDIWLWGDGQIEAAERLSFNCRVTEEDGELAEGSLPLYTVRRPAAAGFESRKSSRSSSACTSLDAIHESSECG